MHMAYLKSYGGQILLKIEDGYIKEYSGMIKYRIDDNYVKEFSQYDPLTVSILSNSGIESIYDRFRKIFTEKGVYLNNENIITSERHKQLLDNSIDAISKAKESYKSGMPIDCISYDIWECGKFLEKITGKSIEADVVETIFSKFCLGK